MGEPTKEDRRAAWDVIQPGVEPLEGTRHHRWLHEGLRPGYAPRDRIGLLSVHRVVQVSQAICDARERERADVGEWLREVGVVMERNGDVCCGRVFDLAPAVEAGEHIGARDRFLRGERGEHVKPAAGEG